MLVDTSHPLSRGTLLHDVFEAHQERPDQKTLQRLMIRSILTNNAYNVVEGRERERERERESW